MSVLIVLYIYRHDIYYVLEKHNIKSYKKYIFAYFNNLINLPFKKENRRGAEVKASKCNRNGLKVRFPHLEDGYFYVPFLSLWKLGKMRR